ncbi:MAG: hypothetical protein JWQ51_1204 [Tardiphaga sp.]|nr:hypothetical protein [Tardiphaga sp.]
MLRPRVRRKRKHHSFYAKNASKTIEDDVSRSVSRAAMRSDHDFDPSGTLRRLGREAHALGLDLVFYVGVLTLLVVGAVTIWNGLPETVAQARQVAISAGWMTDPPKLRGTL